MYPRRAKNLSQTSNMFHTKIYNQQTNKTEDDLKKLIEKLAINIKLKYNNLFVKNNYSVKQLVRDITMEVKRDDQMNIKFNQYLSQIENSILSKIREENRKKNKPSLENINDKNEYYQKSKSLGNLITLQNQEIPEVKSLPPSRVRLVEENTIKKQDEWAKIAMYNSEKYHEEIRLNKEKEKENKRKINEYLSLQLKEKIKLNDKQKEFENNCYKEQIKMQDKYDKIEKEKKIEYEMKLTKENHLRARVLSEACRHKEMLKENELKVNKKMLDLIKLDILEEEKRQKSKKDKYTEMKRKQFEENEYSKKIKRENEEKLHLENMKYIEENIKLMEKRDQEREQERANRLDKIKKSIDKFVDMEKPDEKSINLIEEKLYLRQIQEKEKIDVLNDKNENFRKKKIYEENKKVLLLQKEEKKKLEENIKIFDKNYGEKVMNSVRKFNDEKNNKFLLEQEKVCKYKTELDKQIQVKSKFKKPTMDEKERIINRDILDKIK